VRQEYCFKGLELTLFGTAKADLDILCLQSDQVDQFMEKLDFVQTLCPHQCLERIEALRTKGQVLDQHLSFKISKITVFYDTLNKAKKDIKLLSDNFEEEVIIKETDIKVIQDQLEQVKTSHAQVLVKLDQYLYTLNQQCKALIEDVFKADVDTSDIANDLLKTRESWTELQSRMTQKQIKLAKCLKLLIFFQAACLPFLVLLNEIMSAQDKFKTPMTSTVQVLRDQLDELDSFLKVLSEKETSFSYLTKIKDDLNSAIQSSKIKFEYGLQIQELKEKSFLVIEEIVKLKKVHNYYIDVKLQDWIAKMRSSLTKNDTIVSSCIHQKILAKKKIFKNLKNNNNLWKEYTCLLEQSTNSLKLHEKQSETVKIENDLLQQETIDGLLGFHFEEEKKPPKVEPVEELVTLKLPQLENDLDLDEIDQSLKWLQ
jgi:hypothetical protein